jgi:hypothetical protein
MTVSTVPAQKMGDGIGLQYAAQHRAATAIDGSRSLRSISSGTVGRTRIERMIQIQHEAADTVVMLKFWRESIQALIPTRPTSTDEMFLEESKSFIDAAKDFPTHDKLKSSSLMLTLEREMLIEKG